MIGLESYSLNEIVKCNPDHCQPLFVHGDLTKGCLLMLTIFLLSWCLDFQGMEHQEDVLRKTFLISYKTPS